jgi:hypothetical protein
MDRIYFGIRTSLAINGELPLSEQSDRLTQENWNEVWMPGAITYQKNAAGLGTLRLLLVNLPADSV